LADVGPPPAPEYVKGIAIEVPAVEPEARA
jgi:hypothetical protein